MPECLLGVKALYCVRGESELLVRRDRQQAKIVSDTYADENETNRESVEGLGRVSLV